MTVIDLSILTQRAGRFSCGATSRNGPGWADSGAPFNQILAYTDDNMGHNATELKFYDLSYKTISG